MQITANTTGMLSDVCIATDRNARDMCVVVIKGTFDTGSDGNMRLAAKQRPLVYADEHYGAPETTSVRFECDFSAEKPLTDVIVVGKAIAPGGRPVEQLSVRLEVQGKVKDLLVFGDRYWDFGMLGLTPSAPEPFTELALTFDRAFGGVDDSKCEARVAVERRNTLGVGFNVDRREQQIAGQRLPNLEDPRQRIGGPRDKPVPIGLGCIGRGWKPRLDYAGAYDQQWLDETLPFLPPDFDNRYFQCAPEDQQFPIFRGGERIRCVHMSESGTVSYRIPEIRVPVTFRFLDREVRRDAQLDTVVLLPHEEQAMLTWRAHVAIGKKWNQLRGILVGERREPIDDGPTGYLQGKPKFRDLGAALRWLAKRPADRE